MKIWGTRGRIGLFYVVDVAKGQKPASKLPIPAAYGSPTKPESEN